MKLTKIPPNGRIAVIGSGISGLSFSYFLNKLRPDIKITIFESRNEPGGWIKSENLRLNDSDSILLEKGPRTLRGVSDGTVLIVDILCNLKKQGEIECMAHDSIANRKYLLNAENEIVQVPNTAKTFGNFLGSGLVNGLWKGIMGELFVKNRQPQDDDESIESFLKRRFGTNILSNNIVSGIIHGIYAGDVSRLSVQSVLPSLVNLEAESGSIIKGMLKKLREKPVPKQLGQDMLSYQRLISPDSDLSALSRTLKRYPMLKLKSGLQTLPNAIANYLKIKDNVEIVYNSNIQEIDLTKPSIRVNDRVETYNHIRSTINTNALNKLIINDSIKSLLPLEYVSIFLVNIYSAKPILIPHGKNGFGFLVPKCNKNPECLLGIIYDSDVEQNLVSLYQESSPHAQLYNKITLMMGGHYYNKLGVPSDALKTKAVKTILSSILHIDLSKHNLVFQDPVHTTKRPIADNDIVVSCTMRQNAIPQYNTGYAAQMHAATEILEHEFNSHLSFGGMAFGNGIGVPDCVLNALTGALKLS